MKSDSHVVYGIVNPFNNYVFYVGQTNDFYKRRKQHSIKSHSDTVRNTIQEIKNLGGDPVFFIIEKCCSDTINESEKKWIKHFRLQFENLCNIKSTGLLTVNLFLQEETVELLKKLSEHESRSQGGQVEFMVKRECDKLNIKPDKSAKA